jgi:hypothetical protein
MYEVSGCECHIFLSIKTLAGRFMPYLMRFLHELLLNLSLIRFRSDFGFILSEELKVIESNL